MEIEIGGQVIQVEEIDKPEKGITELTITDEIDRTGVIRLFKDSLGAIILEYYNGRCLKFRNWKEYLDLQRVDFLFLYHVNNGEFTYKFEIDENRFNELRLGLKPIGLPSELNDLGEFYLQKNKTLLLKGNKYWATSSYYVLERIETLIAIDFDYIYLFKNLIKSSEPRKLTAQEILPREEINFKINLLNGNLNNVEEAREIISKELNIPKNRLDYSVRSLHIIDDAWIWNQDANEYDLQRPCLAYVAECILRNNEGYKLEGRVDYYLISETGKTSDISAYTMWLMIDTDTVPSVHPIYESVLTDLEN